MDAPTHTRSPNGGSRLNEAQRERFLAENADGSMTLEWAPTEYDLAMSKALAGQKEGAVIELPNPLDFPQVVDPMLKPPSADEITPVPHTPAAPGADTATTSEAVRIVCAGRWHDCPSLGSWVG